MKTKRIASINLIGSILLGVVLVFPVAAEAGKGHHRYGHSRHHHHYDHHAYGHGHSHRHHHYGKQRYKPYYYGGYNRIYNQPRRYYSQPYNYYLPAPAYGYPPNRMIGINTGNASFMLRY